MGTLVRATNLLGFDDLVRELGRDPLLLRQRHGIAPGIEHVEDGYVSYESAAQMIEAAAAEVACPDFGLRLSARQYDLLGPLVALMRNAATVLDVGLDAIRYMHLQSPAVHFAFAEAPHPGLRPGQLTVTFELDAVGASPLVHAYELTMANAVRTTRLLGGEDVNPTAVYFRHSRSGPEESYVEALQTPLVHFEQDWCGWHIAEHLLRRPVNHADPTTRRILERYLASSLPPETGLAPRVAELIRKLLPTGTCSADTLALHLGMHPRTLQRRLAEEETSYAAILDHERSAQSIRLLANPGLALREIVALLGYTEQSTFNRAFRRWHGTTPRDWRRRPTGLRFHALPASEATDSATRGTVAH
jgi:AraC-like DNA-binding protein